MKRHWIYAALALGGFALFLFGAVVGRLAAPVNAPSAAQTLDDAETRDMAEVLDVIRRPIARKLFDAAASNKAGEIELVTTRSNARILASKAVLFTSDAGQEFAGARLDLEMLADCGLLEATRRVTDRGSTPRESIVYAMTPRGHQIAEMLKGK